MKTSLSLLLIVGCVFVSSITKAQQTGTWLKDGEPGNPLFRNQVGLTVGTQGIGAEVGIPLSTRFNMRLGASLLPYKKTSLEHFNSQYDYNTDLKVEVMNLKAILDWQPFPNAGGFFNRMALSAGGAYFYKAKGRATAMLDGNYTRGEIVLTPEEVGYVKFFGDWTGWAPYAGIGWHNIKIVDTFNIGFDLGGFYLGKPDDVHMAETNLFVGNAQRNEPILRRNLNDYKWLPNFQINLKFNY